MFAQLAIRIKRKRKEEFGVRLGKLSRRKYYRTVSGVRLGNLFGTALVEFFDAFVQNRPHATADARDSLFAESKRDFAARIVQTLGHRVRVVSVDGVDVQAGAAVGLHGRVVQPELIARPPARCAADWSPRVGIDANRRRLSYHDEAAFDRESRVPLEEGVKVDFPSLL